MLFIFWFWKIFQTFKKNYILNLSCLQHIHYLLGFQLKGTEFWPQILILKSYIFAIWWCKPLIFQTIIIWSKMIDSLKYLRSPTLKCKDIGKRKSEFVTKTQFIHLPNYPSVGFQKSRLSKSFLKIEDDF